MIVLWDSEKQKAFSKLEMAVDEKRSSMRIMTGDNGKYLGLFVNEEDANIAYQKALNEINER